MKEVEERFQQPVETLLPEIINQHGLTHAAAELGVSAATISYWMLKLGIQCRVALSGMGVDPSVLALGVAAEHSV